ncbi:MAG: glycosyltransferase [Pseudomonadales bacterium]|nr:glycosyltransferase [Pseudomonadales bacterium]
MKGLISRIAIFSDCNSPGGVWVYSLRTAKMFVADENFCSVLITHPARNDEEKKRILTASSIFNKIVYIRRPVSDFLPDIALAKEFASTINSLDIDIYIPNYRNYTYVALHWINKSVASIGVCHNNHHSYFNVIRRYITLLGGVICPNSEAATILNNDLKRFDVPINYIPHYIEPLIEGGSGLTRQSEVTQIENTDRPLSLIYFGRIEKEQKEIFELLNIVKSLQSKHQNVMLKVIGDGKEKPNFINEVKKLGLESSVTIYDAMGREDLIPFIVDSDFSIICSRYEGFCYSAAESMALGVPVACYKNNAMSDYVINMNNGIEVEWGDEDGLANNMVAISCDTQRYQSMSEAAIDTIQNDFSEVKVLSQYKAIFEKAYSKRESKYWPILRPRVEPKGSQILERVMELLGKKLGVWF